MNLNNEKLLRSALATMTVASVLSSSLAFSAGFEKSVMWSGKWAPVGGAAASSVSGAEALYFNPAGLAAGDSKGEITGDFSPIFGKFSGPIVPGGATLDSNRPISPSFGLFGSYKPMEKLGVGVGAYVAGGSRAIYDGVDFTPLNANFANSSATVKSDVTLIELSAGAGYELLDGLRIGAAWRVSFVRASLASYAYRPAGALSTLTTVDIENLSATRFNGFRLGAQYYPKESRWGLGAVWRTPVNFTAQGDLTGATTLQATGGKLPTTGGTAYVSNIFPQAFDIGTHYDVIPNGLRAHLQYTFTNYSEDQQLALDAPITVAGATIPLSNIDQYWNNMHNVRVGLECFELANWVFRAGYVFTSQVTPSAHARATFSSPGNGHTVLVGAGTSWLDKTLDTNLGVEYSWAKGTVTADQGPDASGTAGLPGDYSSNDYAAHLGVTYHL